MIFAMSGCSQQHKKMNTEAETAPIDNDTFYKEGVAETETGNMHTYSYAYISGDTVVKGKVYILQFSENISNTEKEAIADKMTLGIHDYAVIDYRIGWDPDLQVRNSYKANTERERQCVIDILLHYEESYPSDWERSVNSMKNEWYWHNSAYNAGYNTKRAKDVDFNNKDEKNYPTLNPFKNE